MRLTTARIHTLTTVPANEQTMTALQELADSAEPGRVEVINGAAIFLTDTERDARDTATLGPEDFGGDLFAYRNYLRDLARLLA